MRNLKHLFAASATGVLALVLFQASAPVAPQPQDVRPKVQGIQLAGLFGESEEEKAARLAREQKEADQDTAIGELRAEVRDLQDTVRRLTGQNEVLGHQVEQFQSKIDRLQKDFDYKLCTVTAQQVGGDTASLPCGGGMSGGTGAATPNYAPAQSSYSPPPPPVNQQSSQNFDDNDASAAPRTLAPPPGVLGTLPQKTASLPPAGTTLSPTATGTPTTPYRGEFDRGLNLLGKAQYDDARVTFRSYADNHPKDELAPQAVFWVANIAYVQKDYSNAAHTFAEQIKKYPNNDRAPESMLKLGQSLIAMGQKKEGCFTLASLPATYPKASKNTLGQAVAAQKASACK
ncbi:MAG TPA: tol-pal system protein YbgF [Rhizomicrobium sp.]|jgi:tol-pal system protein YbgF|nr:tol-pal system protein YbgF [Rhizomicrobium sp.]